MRSRSHGPAGLPTVLPRMTTRGDLPALVDGAPGELRTLQGALTTWTHRSSRAEGGPGRPSGRATIRPGSATSPRCGRRAWRDDGAADEIREHDDAPPDDEADPAGAYDAPRRRSPSGTGRRPAPGAEQRRARGTAVVVRGGRPARPLAGGRPRPDYAVSDGRRSWAGTSTLVTERDSSRAAITDAGQVIGAFLYPARCSAGSSWPTRRRRRSRDVGAGSSVRCPGRSLRDVAGRARGGAAGPPPARRSRRHRAPPVVRRRHGHPPAPRRVRRRRDLLDHPAQRPGRRRRPCAPDTEFRPAARRRWSGPVTSCSATTWPRWASTPTPSTSTTRPRCGPPSGAPADVPACRTPAPSRYHCGATVRRAVDPPSCSPRTAVAPWRRGLTRAASHPTRGISRRDEP